MGRPLKIKKSTTIDIGFNALASLTNPVLPSPIWDSATEYLGVVGGATAVDTATYPTVKCRVFITGFAEEDGFIIRQKGSHKYLVGGTTSRTALVAGSAYRILTVGNTAWTSYGASGNPQVGDIFTATVNLADTGTGVANAVGVCVLSSAADDSLTAGNMNITYSVGDSTATNVSKLTNKFLQNFAGGATGGSANTGDVWAATDTIDNVVLAANFFSDEGTTAKSGADVATWASANGSEQNADGTLDLGIVENYRG
jgi:predicted RNA binding protein YcfA (HicA-like mRNA interferase family)